MNFTENGKCSAKKDKKSLGGALSTRCMDLTFPTSNLNVDASTVCRIVQTFNASGTVEKKRYPHGDGHHLQRTTIHDEHLILELVAENPSMYLRELQGCMCESTGTIISTSTICNLLHKNGFSRQKLTRIAGQRNDVLKAQYVFDIRIFSPDMLVFVDETGTDRCDTLRRYGYSLRGKPAKAFSTNSRGNHLSALAATSTEGVLAAKLLKEE